MQSSYLSTNNSKRFIGIWVIYTANQENGPFCNNSGSRFEPPTITDKRSICPMTTALTV